MQKRNKMKAIPWKGVYPALTTKFTASEKLDIPAFLRNVDAQIKAGVNGLILGGSLGESSTLQKQERIELLEATLKHVKGELPVILNIAEGSTQQGIALAEAAEECGADGLMLLPPMLYQPTQQELLDYFSTIAKSTSLPILIYNNPVDYKVEVPVDLFEELLRYENIQAVKESTRDVSNVTRLRNRYGNRLKILCGVDTLAMEQLVMGADGWVAGLVCAFPKETVAIYQSIQEGNIERALEIYRWFLPLLELDIQAQLVQNIKLAESLVDLGSEYVRAPRKILEGVERKKVFNIIQSALQNRPLLSKKTNPKLTITYDN